MAAGDLTSLRINEVTALRACSFSLHTPAVMAASAPASAAAAAAAGFCGCLLAAAVAAAAALSHVQQPHKQQLLLLWCLGSSKHKSLLRNVRDR